MVEIAPFVMVVLIVAIVSWSRMQRARYGAMSQVPVEADGDAERLRGELARLKDRVAVLERIVTDGDRSRGLALEREIEALRDRREEGR